MLSILRFFPNGAERAFGFVWKIRSKLMLQNPYENQILNNVQVNKWFEYFELAHHPRESMERFVTAITYNNQGTSYGFLHSWSHGYRSVQLRVSKKLRESVRRRRSVEQLKFSTTTMHRMTFHHSHSSFCKRTQMCVLRKPL